MLSTDLILDVTEKIEQKYNNIEYFQEQVVLVDNEKSLYDQGIVTIDTDLYTSISDVNNSLIDVQTAYQNRIKVGCRTDVFWRVIGINTGDSGPPVVPASFTIQATQISIVGYGTVGFATTSGGVGLATNSVVVFDGVGITTYSLNSLIGISQTNFYGIKYYDEPYSRDIGNTFVTSFIGTISIGSSILTVMNPIENGISNLFKIGQIVLSSKDGVFSPLVPTKIVGVGTTTADIRSVYPSTGIGTTAPVVNRLILDTVASASASAPELDGSFVTFTVIDDPEEFSSEGRNKYGISFTSNPFSPQTVGIMTTGTIGIGVSIDYDNSGNPSASQSWDPSFNGVNIDGNVTNPPSVGAGKIYYKVGFTEAPINPSTMQKAPVGTILTLPGSIIGYPNLTTTLSTCPTEENELQVKVGIASSKEQSIKNSGGDINLKINAVNALRLERNNYNLRIWGLRQSIGGENQEIDRYDALKTYIGLSTISEVVG